MNRKHTQDLLDEFNKLYPVSDDPTDELIHTINFEILLAQVNKFSRYMKIRGFHTKIENGSLKIYKTLKTYKGCCDAEWSVLDIEELLEKACNPQFIEDYVNHEFDSMRRWIRDLEDDISRL